MPVIYENNKLSKKQKIAKEILDDLDNKVQELYSKSHYSIRYEDVDKIISDKKISYGLEAHYPTLREYIKEHYGCRFLFKIEGTRIETTSVNNFLEVYNGQLLDKYIVKRSRRCNLLTWLDGGYICVKLYLKEKRIY